MNERLKIVRNYLKLNQNDLGKEINLSRSHISSLENGSREVTDRVIADYCRSFNVSESWLRTGEGEMFVEPKTFTLDEKALKYDLSELEIEIMKNYMELDQHVRKSILNMLGKSFKEAASTTDTEFSIDEEVERYRQELEASKKAQKSSVSHEQSESETS